MKMKTKKRMNMFLSGFLAFAMTSSYIQMPFGKEGKMDTAEALTIGASRTFNNTSTGRTGANVNNSSGTLGGTISMSDGMYHWTVPETGNYEINAYGARGGNGNYRGGYGARTQGDFLLEKGQNIILLVGQSGYDTTSCTSGGGGSFVTRGASHSSAIPLIVAGGGGGGGWTDNSYKSVTTESGGRTSDYSGGVGTSGNGGVGDGSRGTNGAGFYGNAGTTSYTTNVATSFRSGGVGGYYSQYPVVVGGFGGGGPAHTNCEPGGGGGYSGGIGAFSSARSTGGGGGMYNIGANELSQADVRNGHGQVVITSLVPVIKSQSPANATKFQNNYIDVNWTGDNTDSNYPITKYEIKAGTTPGGSNVVPITNKGLTTSHRINVPPGTPGNTTIYWSVRVFDSRTNNESEWKEQTVIYSNNVPKITATTNTPANLDVSLEKRHHQFSINSLVDPDDFNYVSLFADVLDKNGTVIPGSKKQIVLDSSLVNSAKLISGTSTEKDGSLQGPFNHTSPFNLKLALEPDFTTGEFSLTLTKADGVTNVVKSNQKLITNKTMQATTDASPDSYTLRVYPEDRQNTNTLANSPLASIPDVTPILIPFTSDTRNYLPNLTNMKNDVAKRVFSDSEGFNRISVTGHVDDSDPADKVTMYYEVQPKAANYNIEVKTVSGKVVPKYGKSTQTFNPKVNNDFAFTYQVDPALDSGNYALLVYGYDSQEGIGNYHEIPFTVSREGPTIDFIADYATQVGQTIKMSSAQKQIVAEDNKIKLYFTPNNYATFEYAGYLVRAGQVKDLRIRGAFTNDVKASFIGVDLGQSSITLLDNTQTKFQLNDVIVFKFKATSSTGIVTSKDVRVLVGNDSSTFTPLDDSRIPVIP